eukprot:4403027-Pyramimonas_sp.AAC.1
MRGPLGDPPCVRFIIFSRKYGVLNVSEPVWYNHVGNPAHGFPRLSEQPPAKSRRALSSWRCSAWMTADRTSDAVTVKIITRTFPIIHMRHRARRTATTTATSTTTITSCIITGTSITIAATTTHTTSISTSTPITTTTTTTSTTTTVTATTTTTT